MNNPSLAYIKAERQSNGQWRLFYRGTRNAPEVSPGNYFITEFPTATQAKRAYLSKIENS